MEEGTRCEECEIKRFEEEENAEFYVRKGRCVDCHKVIDCVVMKNAKKSKGFKGRNMRGVKGDRRGPLKRSDKK
jgi:hypothetical protein